MEHVKNSANTGHRGEEEMEQNFGKSWCSKPYKRFVNYNLSSHQKISP